MSVARVILAGMTAKASGAKPCFKEIFTTAELAASGKSDTAIRTLVRRGSLVRIRRGVYASGTLARRCGEHTLRVAGALSLTMRGAVASHHSAAQLHGLDLLEGPGTQVTLTVPAGCGRAGRAGVRYYTAALPRRQVASKFGVPVTSVARTVVDLARVLEFRAGVVAADSALHQGLTSKEDLRAVLATCRRWPGIERAAEVVEFADGLTESPLESIARVVIRDTGLPPPQLQVWVGGDEVIGRADFYWPQYKTIVEVDGAKKFANPQRAIGQLRRDKMLSEAGFEVLHFSWYEITQMPEYVARSIRAAFERGLRRAS